MIFDIALNVIEVYDGKPLYTVSVCARATYETHYRGQGTTYAEAVDNAVREMLTRRSGI